VLALGQRGGEGQAVHPVLEEPQQRVGDHRVEVVVGLRFDLDQAQAHGRRPRPGVVLVEQPRLGIEGDLDGLAVVLGDHGRVLLGAGGAHPDGVGQVRHQSRERRDQPTRATTAGAAAGLVARERHRSTVRQQHHRQAGPGHAPLLSVDHATLRRIP
jgi:hypothetical protein